MTGLSVTAVNIIVDGVNVPKDDEQTDASKPAVPEETPETELAEETEAVKKSESNEITENKEDTENTKEETQEQV